MSGRQRRRAGRRDARAGSRRLLVAGSYALPFAAAFGSFLVGRYPVDPWLVARIIGGLALPIDPTWPPTTEVVVVDVRLPRVLLALLVGGGLALGGAAFQGMFRNPLVSPDLLGVSSAAGFGAVLAILVAEGSGLIYPLSFGFGLLGVAITYAVARVHRTTPTIMLVLSGVVVSSFFGALISVAKFTADPDEKLPSVVFWLLGSLSGATDTKLAVAAAIILTGSAVLIALGWRINVLSLGDEEARALGVSVERVKATIIVCVTVITATAVALTGIIGWVGLVIPHIARMLVGPDHRRVLPVAFSLGAAYLLVMDDLARSVMAQEVPIGILTAALGAPIFAVLLRRTSQAWT